LAAHEARAAAAGQRAAREAAARAVLESACGELTPDGACAGCGGAGGGGGCARCGAVGVAVVGKGHIKGIALGAALLAAAAAGRGAAPALAVDGAATPQEVEEGEQDDQAFHE
jgi:hypothetical protein